MGSSSGLKLRGPQDFGERDPLVVALVREHRTVDHVGDCEGNRIRSGTRASMSD
jgi:hypothetical protein